MLGNSDSPVIVEPTCGGSIHLQQSAIDHENIVEETPLVIACKNGNLKQVRHLVEDAQVNVDQRSIIWCDENNSYSIHGTALHATVISGQVQVVNYLLDGCKADINAKAQSVFENDSDGGSTALHLAILHVSGAIQIEIFNCLLTHGADWSIVDEHGQQCWERTGLLELTKLLVQFRVGFDSSQNPKSSTIAHKWAKSFHPGSAEVIMLAIDEGIDIYEPDNEGSTPLVIAAIGKNWQPNVSVVGALFKQRIQPIGQLERIDALELMGATLISGGEVYGIELLRSAMEIKWKCYVPAPSELSDDVKTALGVTSEVYTMHELEYVARDAELLQVQAHLIRLRILGIKHSETMRCLAFQANHVCLTKPQTFFKYLHLILKGIDSTEIDFWDSCAITLFSLSLFALTRAGDCMPSATFSTFNNAMPLLRKLVSLLNNANDNRRDNFITDDILSVIVNLTHVILNGKPLTSQESYDFKCCLTQAVRLGKRTTEGLDLFLLACSKSEFTVRDVVDWPEEVDGDINGICFQRCCSFKTISIFIEVGCDVDSVTNEGDTGLHILAKNVSSSECMQSFEMLYHADVHVDQKNLKGKTMIDILRERGIPLDRSIIPACLLEPTRLKCLSARRVPQQQIPLLEQLSRLSEFLTRHGKMNK